MGILKGLGMFIGLNILWVGVIVEVSFMTFGNLDNIYSNDTGVAVILLTILSAIAAILVIVGHYSD